MVRGKETVEVGGHTFVVERNVPFEAIPQRILKLFDFDLDEYYRHVPFLNKSCWNYNLMLDGAIVATAWGNYFPLERMLYVHRLGIDKRYQHTLMLYALVDKIFEIGRAHV